ncbi:phage tail protein [Fulvivirga ligni]|uniref:phage tail protein n=1 Tax=Fulvivirga ligni TaxID=2904246 RepID=UPI001F3729C2|nr:tail fiber protein [Fulvivirga ligni]UII19081.1 tail fiber protein [Fulvivirga ligni]
MDGTISEIRYFGPSWTPRNWLPCDGRLLSIAQFTAFFSLIGSIYGGDARTTFGLPDLRGRAIVGSGSGPGLTTRINGQGGGTETVTLNVLEMPVHNHAATTQLGGVSVPIAATGSGTVATPSPGYYPGVATDINADELKLYTNTGTTVTAQLTGNATTILGLTGSGQPHNNMQPWKCVTPIICYEGTYPTRS